MSTSWPPRTQFPQLDLAYRKEPDHPLTVQECLRFAHFRLLHPTIPSKMLRPFCYQQGPTGGYNTMKGRANPYPIYCNECRGCLRKEQLISFLDTVLCLLQRDVDRGALRFQMEKDGKLPQRTLPGFGGDAVMPSVVLHFLSELDIRSKDGQKAHVAIRKKAQRSNGKIVYRGVLNSMYSYSVVSNEVMVHTKSETKSEPVVFQELDDAVEFIALLYLDNPDNLHRHRRWIGTKVEYVNLDQPALGQVYTAFPHMARHQALNEAGIHYQNPDRTAEPPRGASNDRLIKQGPQWLRQKFGLRTLSSWANDQLRKKWSQEQIDRWFPEYRAEVDLDDILDDWDLSLDDWGTEPLGAEELEPQTGGED